MYCPDNRHQRNLRRKCFRLSDEVRTEDPATTRLICVEPGNNREQVTIGNGSYVVPGKVTDPLLVNTFDSELGEINKNLPWAWEEVYGPSNMTNILNALQEGTLYAVSDGSYMDGIGTSASILDDGRSDRIWCLSRTPGAHRYQNSH